MQHPLDGSVIDSLIGVHWLGIVLLDNVIHVGELLKAIANIGIAARSCVGILLGKENAEESADCEKQYDKKEGTTRTTGHLRFSFA
jgi:hypothetical protein